MKVGPILLGVFLFVVVGSGENYFQTKLYLYKYSHKEIKKNIYIVFFYF